MAFFTVQRNGFLDVSTLINSVINDMQTHGFTVVYPSSYNSATPLVAPYKVTLEAGADVDPLHATQPWRICFNVTGKEMCGAYAATPLQLKDDGTIAPINSATGQLVMFAGSTGIVDDTIDSTNPSSGFVNRTKRVAGDSAAFPLNYRLTITDRGFFLGVFEGNWASVIYQTGVDAYFNWMLVQRPVNKTTGATLVTGKCPVFCVNKVNDGYWKFVVREADIPHPTNQVAADSHTEDSFKLFNSKNQISITEDKKYLVSFMNNLNTPRFRYTEELDIVGLVSSDVIMDTIPTQITVYGSPRIYTAMPGSTSFNTGVKLLILTSPTV